MKVLVACEFSGIVRDAFIREGHDAVSCDILPSDSDFGPHVQGDIFDMDFEYFDLMIAHPPCTYLTNASCGWLYLPNQKHVPTEEKLKDVKRWESLDEGAAFFKRLLEAPVKHKAIENPIPHKYAVERIGRKYDQLVQPWQYGHGETKATCFWLHNLPKLVPTDIVEGREQRLHRLPPSENRAKIRSTTYAGIARAMSTQWSNL